MVCTQPDKGDDIFLNVWYVLVSWFKGWFVVIVSLFVLPVILDTARHLPYGVVGVQLGVSMPVDAGTVWCLRRCRLGLESWAVFCRYKYL